MSDDYGDRVPTMDTLMKIFDQLPPPVARAMGDVLTVIATIKSHRDKGNLTMRELRDCADDYELWHDEMFRKAFMTFIEQVTEELRKTGVHFKADLHIGYDDDGPGQSQDGFRSPVGKS